MTSANRPHADLTDEQVVSLIEMFSKYLKEYVDEWSIRLVIHHQTITNNKKGNNNAPQ